MSNTSLVIGKVKSLDRSGKRFVYEVKKASPPKVSSRTNTKELRAPKISDKRASEIASSLSLEDQLPEARGRIRRNSKTRRKNKSQ